MRSNLSVAMPIDLVQYENDQLKLSHRRRFDAGDSDFAALSREWSEGVRNVFRHLPDVRW
jgi:putative proteasome-type protease